MATRYSGGVKVACKLVAAPNMPHGEQYRCVLSNDAGKIGVQYVGLPAHLTHAIDSPAAYDAAAHAAISFALDEGMISERDVLVGESGHHIHRKNKLFVGKGRR